MIGFCLFANWLHLMEIYPTSNLPYSYQIYITMLLKCGQDDDDAKLDNVKTFIVGRTQWTITLSPTPLYTTFVTTKLL